MKKLFRIWLTGGIIDIDVYVVDEDEAHAKEAALLYAKQRGFKRVTGVKKVIEIANTEAKLADKLIV